uniref:Uncharacterized protein n=1 Tax=Pseudomonas phage Touem01 TaxID=3138548 RepID=A0AAU6W2Q5_9VIRU
MSRQFYLQDSRSHVGDGLTFWAKEGKGYTTNLDNAELFTAEQATRHRDSDIPWPQDYIDARAHYGVDHQVMDDDLRVAGLKPGTRVYIQVPGDWNGNDVYWVGHQRGQVTADLGRAIDMDLENSQFMFGEHAGKGTRVFCPADYINTIRRRLVWRQDVNLKEALRGTGIKLPKPQRAREMVFNCTGCGRFVSDRQRFQYDCRHCGADNCP